MDNQPKHRPLTAQEFVEKMEQHRAVLKKAWVPFMQQFQADMGKALRALGTAAKDFNTPK